MAIPFYTTDKLDTLLEAKADNGEFQIHRITDTARWNDYFDTKAELLETELSTEGLKTDTGNLEELTQSEMALGHTSTDDLGCVLDVTVETPSLVDFKEVGTTDWVHVGVLEGLPDGTTYHFTFRLDKGDSLRVSGVQSAVCLPIVYDTDSGLVQLYNTLNVQIGNMQKEITTLQTELLDYQSKVDNKSLDTQNAVEIKNMTYTVNNTLGGRITCQGIRTVSLLGITVLSTGIVSIDGKTDPYFYDNTSLLAVGPAEVKTTDVYDGQVIYSSGMETVQFIPYVAS